MTKGLVSIIIPVYNVEKYLKQCLESVINQSYTDLEIICVNDGSTDGSLSILREYEKKDSRIKVFSQDNGGLGYARNIGVLNASGDYVYFIDSDDWIEKKCIERLYKNINENDSDLCILGLKIFDEEEKKFLTDSYWGTDCYKCNDNEKISFIDIKNVIFRRFGIFTKFFRKSFILENHLVFDEGVFFEDVSYHVKSLLLARKISICNENLYIYRKNRPKSIMNDGFEDLKQSDKSISDLICFLKEVKSFLCKRKVFEELKKQYFYFLIEQIEFHRKKHKNIQVFRERISNFLEEFPLAEVPQEILLKLDDYLHYEILVTVIVPVYNTQDYLEQCLNSISCQSLSNIEVICINDGSTDHSQEILNRISQTDNRFIVIEQKNKGQGCSRNRALSIAKGKYILFVDSDDWISGDTLELLTKKCEAYRLDMLSFSGNNFYSNPDKEVDNPYWSFSFLPPSFPFNTFNHRDCRSFITSMPVSSCLTMYRNAFLKENKIRFPEGLFFEDNVFFVKSILSAKRCGIEKTKLYHRRIHSSSVTQNWNSHFSDYIRISELVIEWVKVSCSKEMFDKYQNSYVTGCINRFNSFDITDKTRYLSQLEAFLRRQNICYKVDKQKAEIKRIKKIFVDRRAILFKFIKDRNAKKYIF